MGIDTRIGEDGTIDVAATLAIVRGRDLDRDGIPMLLALEGACPAPADDPRRQDGARLAQLLIDVHAELSEDSDAPRSREAREALAEGREPAAVMEGLDDDAPLSVELEARAAVPVAERIVAEAISVVAHAELLGAPSARRARPAGEGDPPGPGSPLARTVNALREGRFVTVVNYHNTPASGLVGLVDELREWSARYAPIDADGLATLTATGRWPHARPPLIPVFYEGYRNNHDIAAPACEAAGLVGWFFLITGFIDAAASEQISFADAHDIGLVAEERRAERVAMTWPEASALAERHVVTSHSAHHVPARLVADERSVKTELVEPSAAIERVTGHPAVAHAWLFGSELADGGAHARTLARLGYRWVFSNIAIQDVVHCAGAPTP